MKKLVMLPFVAACASDPTDEISFKAPAALSAFDDKGWSEVIDPSNLPRHGNDLRTLAATCQDGKIEVIAAAAVDPLALAFDCRLDNPVDLVPVTIRSANPVLALVGDRAASSDDDGAKDQTSVVPTLRGATVQIAIMPIDRSSIHLVGRITVDGPIELFSDLLDTERMATTDVLLGGSTETVWSESQIVRAGDVELVVPNTPNALGRYLPPSLLGEDELGQFRVCTGVVPVTRCVEMHYDRELAPLHSLSLSPAPPFSLRLAGDTLVATLPPGYGFDLRTEHARVEVSEGYAAEVGQLNSSDVVEVRVPVPPGTLVTGASIDVRVSRAIGDAFSKSVFEPRVNGDAVETFLQRTTVMP